MDERKELGQKIKTARKENGLSQRQLAQMLGITNAAVCRWENGRTQPKSGDLIKMMTILGIKFDEN